MVTVWLLYLHVSRPLGGPAASLHRDSPASGHMPHVLNLFESKNMPLPGAFHRNIIHLCFWDPYIEGQLYFLISFQEMISNRRSKTHYHLYFILQCPTLSGKVPPNPYFPNAWCSLSDKHCFCLIISALLCNGKFHKHLQEIFVPLVIRYVDLMESSIAQSIHRGFEQETWQPVK